MKIILFNGSPKGNLPTSGSYLIAKAFVKNIKCENEIIALVNSNHEQLYQKIATVDYVLFVIPVYIHSVPSFVLDFLYHLPTKHSSITSIGYILQSGYPESSESEIVCRQLEHLTKKLGYHFLGNVVKGECAGLAFMPNQYHKLLDQFTQLGEYFEQTKAFNRTLVTKFAEPVRLSNSQVRMLNMMQPLSRIFSWNRMQKKYQAFDHRYDTPFVN